MERSLGIFKHSIGWRITGRQPRSWEEGVWDYPLVATSIEEEGFEEIGVNILKRQNTVAQNIVTQLILDLCKQLI